MEAGFQIYQSGYHLGFGSAIVVLTGRASDRSVLLAEWFLVIPDLDCYYDRCVLRCPADKTSAFNLEALIEYARYDAQRHLQVKLGELYLSQRDPVIAFAPLMLTAAKPATLINMWLDEQCRPAILRIADETTCRRLKEFIRSIESLRIDKSE